MNDTKHDIEKIGENSTRRSWKIGRFLTRISLAITARIYKVFRKYFTNPMRAIEKDGSTKRLAVSPPITKDEAKMVIAKAREEGVLVCLKEMQPDGDQGRGKSLFSQGRIAKHDIKAAKWKERSKAFKLIAPISKFSDKRADHHMKLSAADSKAAKDERFIIICNESRISFMNDRLEDIEKLRIQKKMNNELEDINKDGVIDERDILNLHSLDMELEPEELEPGRDYGSCMVRDYQSNFCTQTVPKDEYCSIRSEMFNMKSHGAFVLNDNRVLLAFPKDELKEYQRYGTTAYPIKEYGTQGGNAINSEKNNKNLISMKITDPESLDKFREKYEGHDYIAEHNSDGSCSIMVKEDETERMVELSAKKSATASLLEEAKNFVKEQTEEAVLPMEEIELDLDQEELELDY